MTVINHKSARRLLAILRWFEAGEPVTYSRICQEFDVAAHQSQTDLQLLQEFYPIKKGRTGRFAVFHLDRAAARGDALTRALTLDLSSRALLLLEGTNYQREAERLRDAATSTISPAEAKDLRVILSALYFRRIEEPSFSARHEVIDKLLRAIQRRYPIRMQYQRLSNGERRDYDLEPLALVLFREQVQMLGRYRDPPNEIHTFDLDGIIDCTWQRRERFQRSKKFDIPSLFQHAFGRYIDLKPVDVRLRVSGVSANYLRRRRVHPTQQLEELGEDVRVTFSVGLCPDLKAWVMSLVPNVVVEAPQELKTHVRDCVVAMLSRIEGVGG